MCKEGSQKTKREDRREPDSTDRFSGKESINVSGIDIEWNTKVGLCTFQSLPVAMMWVDTTLAGLMSGVQSMVGTRRFVLALQAEGRKSVEADWEVISPYRDFQEGFEAIANIAAVAGWGEWTLISLDKKKKECRIRVTNSWEGLYQKTLGVCWGSGMLAGKMAGYCTKLFERNCWADQTSYIAKGDPYDEFSIKESKRSVEKEIEGLLASDAATRADMAVALEKLCREIQDRTQAENALKYMLRFEELIVAMTTQFVNLPPAQIDHGIREALRKTGDFVNADRSYVFQFRDNAEKMDNTHEWCRDGIKPQIDRLQDQRVADFEPATSILKRGEVLYIPRIADLPAGKDREEFELEGIQSLICVPMQCGDMVFGFVGFDAVRREREWSKETISLLTVVGGMMASVLMRHRAEEAAGDADKRYRTLIETIPAITYTAALDSSSSTLFISPQIESILGISVDLYKSDPDTWKRHLHPDDRDEVMAAVNRCQRTGEPLSMEYRMVSTDRRVVWFRDEAHVVADAHGRPQYILGVMYDVTEHKQLEEQLQQSRKMEAVGKLAGGIAHDFNNMLQAISGYSDLLLSDTKVNESQRSMLNQIHKAANKASTLTGQLLAFSRRQVIEPVDLNLDDVVNGITDLLRHTTGEHISLDIVPCPALGTVHADRAQMEQVLINLCVNARDAMPKGGRITIETENVVFDTEYCRLHSWARPGMYVLLNVTDTGCGMKKDTLDHIFDPFFTTKEVGKGTGLGLATVYGLIKQHQGMIQVHSEEGKGTTFKIYLPLVERPATLVSNKVESAAMGGTETILVAEDDEAVRSLVEKILKGAGYAVLISADGEEALRVFGNHTDEIDLVFLDVVMPKLGGRIVHDRIRKIRPDVRSLFASGYSADSIHSGFVLQEGMEMIQKPYRAKSLLRKIREVLDAP